MTHTTKDEVLEIALTVYTRHDPIFVDPIRLERVLSEAGYTVHLTEMAWPTDDEWKVLTEPGIHGFPRGRHLIGESDSDEVVLRDGQGRWFRTRHSTGVKEFIE